MPTLNQFIRRRRYRLDLHRRRDTSVIRLADETGTEGNIVKDMTFTESIEHPRVDLNVTIRVTPRLTELFDVMDLLVFWGEHYLPDGRTYFDRRGTYFIMSITDTDDQFIKILKCRNAGYWLMRNRYFLKINREETTSQFIARSIHELAVRYGRTVPIEHIDETEYKHEAKVFQNTSLHDAWFYLMTMNSLKERLLYRMRFGSNGFIFEEKRPQATKWIFESEGGELGTNLLNPRRERSVLDKSFINVATAIRLDSPSSSSLLDIAGDFGVGTEEGFTFAEQAVNQDSVDMYGQFPIEVDVTNYGQPDEIQDRLQDIVSAGGEIPDSIRFKTYPIGSVMSGDDIVVYYPNIGSLGEYFIESMTTTIREKDSWHNIRAVKQRDITRDLIEQLSISAPAETRSLLDLPE